MSSFLNGFLVLSVMFTGTMSGYQASIIDRQLHFVPVGLMVTTVVYAAERSDGDTASAPNAGVVVYTMPQALAASLQSGGVAALAQALTGAGFTDRGWRSTPVVVDETWLTRWHTGPASDDLLLEFVVESGMALTVNDAVMKLVHDALISPGAYFATSANAVVVLIPDKRRLVYAYRG